MEDHAQYPRTISAEIPNLTQLKAARRSIWKPPKEKPQSEAIPVGVSALIDRDTFDKVQKTLQAKNPVLPSFFCLLV
jgi:hypothetical protein